MFRMINVSAVAPAMRGLSPICHFVLELVMILMVSNVRLIIMNLYRIGKMSRGNSKFQAVFVELDISRLPVRVLTKFKKHFISLIRQKFEKYESKFITTLNIEILSQNASPKPNVSKKNQNVRKIRNGNGKLLLVSNLVKC